MAPNTFSDPLVAAAFWIGLGALLLTLLLALEILRLRVRLRRSERVEQNTFAKWRPLFNAALLGDAVEALPPMRRQEQLPLLKLWVHLQASLRGAAQDALNDVARRLRLDELARRLLGRGPRAHRLLACLVLGYLRDAQAWTDLLRLAGAKDRVMALNASWALVRIDAKAAAAHLTPLFIHGDHWALPRLAEILHEARDAFADELQDYLPRCERTRLPRALQLAAALRLALPPNLLEEVLRSEDVPLLLVGLRGVMTPDSLPQVSRLLGHADWQVRVQAAKAVGRLGSAADVPALVALLQDPQWWVRYRAAQALLQLPGLGAGAIDEIKAGLADPYAIDMLAQAMAERGGS